jgi:uncharacterized protein (TIRG00374 family)
MKFWKKKQFWGGLLGIGLLAYCLKDIRFSEIELLASRLNLYYLIPAIVCSFLFIIFRGLRWKVLISQQSEITVGRSVSLYSAGQVLNIVMPALTGQVGRLILFARKQGLRKTFVFSTIVMEIIFDAVSLIAFISFASFVFAFPSEYRSISMIVAGVTIAALVGLYLLLHFQENLENFGRCRLREKHPGVYVTLMKFIRSFTRGIRLLRSSQHVAITILYSLLSWTFHMLAIHFLLLSFGFRLLVATAAAIMVVNTIVLMVPITPGNAGTFEISVSKFLLLFSISPISRSDAALFALALHLLDFLPIFVLGGLFLRSEKVSLKELSDEHEDELILDKISEEGTFVEEEQT